MPGAGSRFFRSYAGNLPSSFRAVLSNALECSSSPPVSVSGTVLRQSCFLDRSTRPPNPIRADEASRSSLLAGPGMLTWFPSATAFALALGAGSPCADWPCAGTLGLSATGVLALFVATHVRIRTSDTSTEPRGAASQAYGTLRYHAPRGASAASVRGLSPVTFSPRDGLPRPVSCYAFFKGWLLLSQPPGCLGRPTCFPT